MKVTNNYWRHLCRAARRYSSSRSWVIEDDMSVTHAGLLETTLESHFPSDNGPPALKRGSIVPPWSHLTYFNHAVPESDLAPDGYDNLQAPESAALDLGLIRRWRGGEISFNTRFPLKLGLGAVCMETVTSKESSESVSSNRRARHTVTITREIQNLGSPNLSITETRSLYYFSLSEQLKRRMTQLIAGKPVDPEVLPSRSSIISHTTKVSKVLMFRYSALTFNAHLIHYDTDYARDAEGLATTIVQGPLMVTMVLRWISTVNPMSTIQRISYDIVGSVLAGEEITLNTAPNTNHKGLWEAWVTKESEGIKWLVFKAQVSLAG